MAIRSISCMQNSCVNFLGGIPSGSGVMPQTNPIDEANNNFDVAMQALANAAKALVNAKKAEGAKNEALTEEKIEAKFIAMQNSSPVDYEDLEDMGYGISSSDNKLASKNSKKLDLSIFNGKDTCVIRSKTDRDNYFTCEKYTEYDKKGRPIASIQKITSKGFEKDPIYHAVFFKYNNEYSDYSEMTMYKNKANPNERTKSHPAAALTVGDYF